MKRATITLFALATLVIFSTTAIYQNESEVMTQEQYRISSRSRTERESRIFLPSDIRRQFDELDLERSDNRNRINERSRTERESRSIRNRLTE